jgi:hypothetical protein
MSSQVIVMKEIGRKTGTFLKNDSAYPIYNNHMANASFHIGKQLQLVVDHLQLVLCICADDVQEPYLLVAYEACQIAVVELEEVIVVSWETDLALGKGLAQRG